MPLSGNLHDAQLGNGQDVMLRFVVRHRGLHLLKDFPLVILVLHVDEVDDDQTAQVSEAHLPTNLHRRLDVRLQNEILRYQPMLKDQSTDKAIEFTQAALKKFENMNVLSDEDDSEYIRIIFV